LAALFKARNNVYRPYLKRFLNFRFEREQLEEEEEEKKKEEEEEEEVCCDGDLQI
jgi:SPX domain protein involved in polyphosphate accumulation